MVDVSTLELSTSQKDILQKCKNHLTKISDKEYAITITQLDKLVNKEKSNLPSLRSRITSPKMKQIFHYVSDKNDTKNSYIYLDKDITIEMLDKLSK